MRLVRREDDALRYTKFLHLLPVAGSATSVSRLGLGGRRENVGRGARARFARRRARREIECDADAGGCGGVTQFAALTHAVVRANGTPERSAWR